MMPDLLVYLLKLNGALLLFVGIYYAWLRRLTFHILNRWYLLGSILFSALYPLVEFAALWPRPAALSNDLLVWRSTWTSSAAPAPDSVNDYAWVMAIYWFGVAVLGSKLLVQGLSLRRLHRASVPADSLSCRQIAEAVTPFSFWQTIYLNPRQHRPDELPAILQHEQVHVRQWHTLDVLLGQVQRVFCWFNPAAWLLLRALQENLEFIADQAVLRAGQVDSKLYQYSLVQLSTLAQGPALVTPFTFHTLKNRIKMMNSQKTSRVHTARYLLVAPLMALLLLGSCSQSGFEEAVPAQAGAQQAMASALYFVDGVKSTSDAVEQLNHDDPQAIFSMNVLKGAQVQQVLGNVPEDQVILITTKANLNAPAVIALNKKLNRMVDLTDNLLLVDEKEVSRAEFERLLPAQTQQVTALGPEKAMEAYGEKGKNGSVQIRTK